MGFGTHPHDNMEIITIPLEGDLAHKDSMGNTEIIRNGDVQVMSAGTEKHTGIQSTKTNELNCCKFGFSKKNVEPRYQQITLDPEERNNKLQQILSPNAEDGVWIHQDAWFFG
jgi:redox-sensitive bicupin YhaK (pirin superfamily)